MRVTVAAHAELVDESGPFLSVPVLKETLPNGLDAHDPHVAAEVRAALERWADPDGVGLGSASVVESHLAFVRLPELNVETFEAECARGLHPGALLRWVEQDGTRELVEERS